MYLLVSHKNISKGYDKFQQISASKLGTQDAGVEYSVLFFIYFTAMEVLCIIMF